MDYKYIRLISTIVDCGTISKAAERLNLTQSALSHQLKEIEDREKTLFFIRSNRRLKLTPAGTIVYESAKTILAEIDKLDVSLQNLNSSSAGRIRVTAACTTSYHWLPRVLRAFNAEFPNVEVDIVINNDATPVQEIINGNIDIAVMISPETNNHIRYNYLFDDELVAVFSTEHKFCKKRYLVASDFADQHLIIHSLPLSTVVVYQKVLKPKGIELAKISALPLTEATIELVKSGYGVAVMSRWSIAPYIQNGSIACCPINKNGLFRSHYAACKDAAHPQYFDRFIECLVAAKMLL